jgi:hypothetical protein
MFFGNLKMAAKGIEKRGHRIFAFCNNLKLRKWFNRIGADRFQIR